MAEAQKLEQVQVLDHMNVDDWYVLGVVKFKDPIPQTDYYLKLMDDLESSVIFCKCTIYQSKLYFTVVLHKDNSLSAQQKVVCWTLLTGISAIVFCPAHLRACLK